jgi:hypothetical protein
LDEDVPDLTKDTVKKLLGNKSLDSVVEEVLKIRQELAKTSVSKYKAIERNLCADGRIRGLVQFYGANKTGRWCLAENTQILIKEPSGEIYQKNIQNVLVSDLVWDGDEWVEHEGVVFSGDKEVIEWDEVCGSKEHLVWVSEFETLTLSEAKERGAELWKGNSPFTK